MKASAYVRKTPALADDPQLYVVRSSSSSAPQYQQRIVFEPVSQQGATMTPAQEYNARQEGGWRIRSGVGTTPGSLAFAQIVENFQRWTNTAQAAAEGIEPLAVDQMMGPATRNAARVVAFAWRAWAAVSGAQGAADVPESLPNYGALVWGATWDGLITFDTGSTPSDGSSGGGSSAPTEPGPLVVNDGAGGQPAAPQEKSKTVWVVVGTVVLLIIGGVVVAAMSMGRKRRRRRR